MSESPHEKINLNNRPNVFEFFVCEIAMFLLFIFTSSEFPQVKKLNFLNLA